MNRLAKYSVHTISIILVIAILLPRMPHWIPEDVSRDGKVGLRDAILLVKEFEHSASSSVGSLQDLPLLVTAFHVASGLKQIIKADDHRGLILDDAPFITPSASPSFLSCNKSMTINEGADNFSSIAVKPPLPPPRFFSSVNEATQKFWVIF